MSASAFQERLEQAAASPEYRNYRAARNRVLQMLPAAQNASAAPSRFWSQETAAFEYMLDASPLIVERLREHCYHLTGLRSFDYRHAGGRQRHVERIYRQLRAMDSHELFVPESPALGGFGYEIDGALINVDTLRYYEALIALDRSGRLAPFQNGRSRHLVVEIGAGWGGFAYQFKRLFPNTTYVILDLPLTLLFSATYLPSVLPTARTFIDGDAGGAFQNWADYDLILLPHFRLGELFQLHHPVDLAVNMASFQEMTQAQVDEYARSLHQIGCRALFTANREHSPHNPELPRLEPVLARYFDVKEIALRRVAVDLGGLLARLRYWTGSAHAYRYVLGTPRGSTAASNLASATSA